MICIYCKVPKFWDARNLCCNLPKIQTKRPNRKGLFSKLFKWKLANSEDPDQTAPLSKNLGSLRYTNFKHTSKSIFTLLSHDIKCKKLFTTNLTGKLSAVSLAVQQSCYAEKNHTASLWE